MWIYIPSVSSACVQESVDWTSAYKQHLHTLDEHPGLYVTVNGKQVRKPLSWRGWMTRPWSVHLFRMILETSIQGGVEKWIASLPASPASLGQTSETCEEQKTNDGSGLQSSNQSVACSLRLSSSKTCQDSSADAVSTTYWTILPTAGLMRSGVVYQLPKLELPHIVRESSFWPTPKASDSTRGVCQSESNRRQPSLRQTTYEWACSRRDRNMQSGTASNVLVSTQLISNRHNPVFVSWLMGIPFWWTLIGSTKYGASEMHAYQRRLQRLLSYLLTGRI